MHRVGTIAPGEAIVLVAALSTHRSQAFAAVEEIMDYLKTEAPIWKLERGPSGDRWIEPTLEDRERRARFGARHD
jgi:molybdopterin synthase catalytic subunit